MISCRKVGIATGGNSAEDVENKELSQSHRTAAALVLDGALQLQCDCRLFLCFVL